MINVGSLVRAAGIRLRDGQRQRVFAFPANQIDGVWHGRAFLPLLVVAEGTVMLVLATQNLGQMTNVATVCLVVDKPMFVEFHALEEV